MINNDLLNSQFDNVNMKGSLINKVIATTVTFNNSILDHLIVFNSKGFTATNALSDKKSILMTKDLSNMNFSYLDLSAITLEGTNLDNSILINTNLSNASLSECSIQNADFTNANLSNTNFLKSNLSNSIFYNATITTKTKF